MFKNAADFVKAVRDAWLVLACVALLGLTLILQTLPLTLIAMLLLAIAAVWQVHRTRRRAEMAGEQDLRRLRHAHEDIATYPLAASHDLLEPLRKIDAFAGRLQATQLDRLDENGRQYLDRILDAATRQRRLLDGLRELSRISDAQTTHEMVDLRAAGLSAAETLAEQTALLEARVEISELPVVEADANQMRTLFRHVLGNALKYHRPTFPPVITVTGEQLGTGTGAVARIVIEDRGIGFDDKYAERIFLPLEKLHPVNEYQGSGLGLTIARRIAVRHGGSLTASGQVGIGAVFTLILPLRRETLD